MDIGYASEKVKVFDEKGQDAIIAGHNGKTQLIISTPFINKNLKEELRQIAAMFANESDVEQHIIVANETHQNPNIEHMQFHIDKEGEFGDWYGLRLKGDVLDGELTKSLLLISKDGALYYDEYPRDISQSFDHSMLYRKVTAAQACYTGKGCH